MLESFKRQKGPSTAKGSAARSSARTSTAKSANSFSTTAGVKPRVTSGRANVNDQSCTTIAFLAAARETWPQIIKADTWTNDDIYSAAQSAKKNINRMVEERVPYKFTSLTSKFCYGSDCKPSAHTTKNQSVLEVYCSVEQLSKGFVTMQELVASATAPRNTTCPVCNNKLQTTTAPIHGSGKESLVLQINPYAFQEHGDKARLGEGIKGGVHFSYNGKVVSLGHYTYSVTAMICRVEYNLAEEDGIPTQPPQYHFVCIAPRGRFMWLVDEDLPPRLVRGKELHDLMTGLTHVFLTYVIPAGNKGATAEEAETPGQPRDPSGRRSRGVSEARTGKGKQTNLAAFFKPKAPEEPTPTTKPTTEAKNTTTQKVHTTTLNVVQQNVRSLTYTKQTMIQATNASLVLLQETWRADVKINGYDSHSSPRLTGDSTQHNTTTTRGGGVTTLVKNNVDVTVERLPYRGKRIEAVRIALHFAKTKLIVTNVYIPPDVKASEAELDLLFPEEDRATPTIIAGDLNVHIPEYQPPLQQFANDSDTIENWVERHDLDCMNVPGEITHAGRTTTSVLDYTYSNRTTVRDWKSTPSPHSDHHLISFNIELDPEIIRERAYKPRFVLSKANWQGFTDDLEQLTRPTLAKPSKAWKHWIQQVTKAAKKNIPFANTPKTPQLISKTMSEAQNAATQAKEKWIQSPTASNLEAANKAAERMKEIFVETNSTQLAARMSKLQPGESLDWNTIRGLRKAPAPILDAPLLKPSGTKCTSARDRANTLSATYARHNDSGQSTPKRIRLNKQKTGKQPHITSEELNAAISSAKANSAPGPDGLLVEFLTHLGHKAKQALSDLIDHSLRTGFIPQQLRTATIIPILKPNKEVDNPLSYRPICLTSVLAKLMERIVCRRLQEHWHPHPMQFAYQQGKSGADATALTVDLGTRGMNTYFPYEQPKTKDSLKTCTNYRSERTIAIMIDMSAAFDTVLHGTLIEDLLQTEAPKELVRWIRSFLRGRTSSYRAYHVPPLRR